MFSKSPAIISSGLFLIAIIILLLDANTQLFLWINKIGIAFVDETWIFLTLFGNQMVALVLLSILFWRHLNLLRAVLIAVLISFLITHGIKEFIGLERPYALLNPASFHLIGEKLTNPAFPSGHTATAFAIMGSIGFYFKDNALLLLMLFFATLVGVSRIMLGVHWPIDVVVGAALGWVCAWLGVSLIEAHFLRDHDIWNYVTYTIYLLIASYLFWKGTQYPVTYWVIKIISGLAILMLLSAFIWLFRGGKKEPIRVTGWLS